MGVGDVRERRDHAFHTANRTELGACDQRLAGSWSERPAPRGSTQVDASVEPEPAAIERALPQPAANRAAPPRTRASRRVKAHGAPIPSITLSRVVCRATHATAVAPASARPASTAAISSPLAASGRVT